MTTHFSFHKGYSKNYITWQINMRLTTNYFTQQTKRTHYNFKKDTRKTSWI